MSVSDRLPDYPVNSDFVKKLKSALEGRDEGRLRDLICADVRHVDAVIELANDDWMKDPSAQLPPGVLAGNHPYLLGSPLCTREGWAFECGGQMVEMENDTCPALRLLFISIRTCCLYCVYVYVHSTYLCLYTVCIICHSMYTHI